MEIEASKEVEKVKEEGECSSDEDDSAPAVNRKMPIVDDRYLTSKRKEESINERYLTSKRKRDLKDESYFSRVDINELENRVGVSVSIPIYLSNTVLIVYGYKYIYLHPSTIK